MLIIPFSDFRSKRPRASETKLHPASNPSRIFLENGVAVICFGGRSVRTAIPDFAVPRNDGETVRYIVRTPVVLCANGIVRYPLRITWLPPRLAGLRGSIQKIFQKTSVTSRVRSVSGKTLGVDAWVRSFERTFRNPWHVVFMPNRRMGRDILWKIAQQITRLIASDNGGKAPGIVAFQRETAMGDWPHAHMIVDAERVDLTGCAYTRETFYRPIKSVGDDIDGGPCYVARMLAAGSDFDTLPGTWLKW